VAVRGKEQEDLFVFNDTIEGPRAPAVKPGCITQKWRLEQEEEQEDLFVFNDTIEGPRAPAVKWRLSGG
jgi:hypothetical protein